MNQSQEPGASRANTWMRSFWPALFGVLVGVAIMWIAVHPGTQPKVVRIIKLSHESIVYPPAAIVASGETVVFKAIKTGATITFTDIPSLTPVQLKEGETKTVNLSGVRPGLYQYDVVCDDSSHARGFSGPIIIIE